MRTVRRMAVTVALAASVTASPVSAAPVCRLVADARGDQRLLVAGTESYLTDVDILSADVSVDRKHAVAAVRVATLRPFSAGAPVPRHYDVTFSIDGERGYGIDVYVGNRVQSRFRLPSRVTLVQAVVTLDLERAEVRATLPEAYLGDEPVANGRVVGDVVVTTGLYAAVATPGAVVGAATLPSGGPYGYPVVADTATTARTYRGGTPTCVPMPG